MTRRARRNRSPRPATPVAVAADAARRGRGTADPTPARARGGTGAASRRRFLRLIAAGSLAGLAASLGAPAGAADAPARRRRLPPPTAPPSPAPPPGAWEEICKQKESVAASLRTIRDYALPPGSETAFVFAPLPPAPARPRRSPARPLPRDGGETR